MRQKSTLIVPTLLLIIAMLLSCKQKAALTDNIKNDTLAIENSTLGEREAQGTGEPTIPIENEVPEIIAIRNQISDNKDSLIVLVKVAGQDDLVRVKGENWPEEIETTYNVFKNQKGQILYISEMPMSESGDWDLELNHYYSDSGQLIAFEKRLAFFNGPCLPEDVTVQKMIELYDEHFRVIKTLKSLTDSDGKKLGQECSDIYYDRKHEVRETVREFLELKGIEM